MRRDRLWEFRARSGYNGSTTQAPSHHAVTTKSTKSPVKNPSAANHHFETWGTAAKSNGDGPGTTETQLTASSRYVISIDVDDHHTDNLNNRLV